MSPLRASNAHISLLGHITVEELRRNLTETDIANGFGNRLLYIAARRSKRLPAGGNMDDRDVHELGAQVRKALDVARRIVILKRSPSADAVWERIYCAIDDDDDGLVGALTARAEAQMLRLSVAYALTDGSHTIEVEHLWAAHALWSYAEATVRHVFGDRTGDEVADKLLAALRVAGDQGLDGTEQGAGFGRHVTRPRLDLARQRLEQLGLATRETVQTNGRPRVVMVASKAKEANKG